MFSFHLPFRLADFRLAGSPLAGSPLARLALQAVLLAWLPVIGALAQPAPTPGEGLYDPDSVALPSGVESAVQGVVRATSNIRFQLTVFAHPDSAAAARSAPGARAKVPTDPGTVWPVLIDSSATRSLCASPLTGAPHRNAEGDLRVSIGVVVGGDSAARAKSEPTDILARMDATSGNSGSPVLNRQGEVVGLIRHHTHRKGEIDLNVGAYGGFAQIVPARVLERPVRRARGEQ